MDASFAAAWEEIACLDPTAPALVQGDDRRSWGTLATRAGQLASALAALGVGPGAPVAILSRNRPEYLELTWAAFSLRSSPVNVNYRYTGAEVAEILAVTHAPVLVHDAPGRPAAFDAAARHPGVVLVELPGDGPSGERLEPAAGQLEPGAGQLHPDTGQLGPRAGQLQPDTGQLGPRSGRLEPGAGRPGSKPYRYEDLLERGGKAPRGGWATSGEDVFLICTGGTTGRPKAVMWRQRDLAGWLRWLTWELAGLPFPPDARGAAAVAGEARRTDRAPVTLPACPLVHGTAFFFSIATLVTGGTVVLDPLGHFDASEVIARCARERVTQLVIVGEPFASPLLAALRPARSPRRASDPPRSPERPGPPSPPPLPALRRVFSSGGTWSAANKTALAAVTGATMIDMLGASEGGPFGIEMVAPGSGATGRFRMTERASVRKPDGTAVVAGSGEAGLVAIRPPIPLGYLDDPDATARTFPTFEGTRFSVPGDWAIPEADGTLTLLGRGSSCIVTGGEKVYPEEVEGVLETLGVVADAVVAGAPDDRFGQRVVALVVPAGPAAALSPPELLEQVRAGAAPRLAGYKLPREVIVVPAIRRQPSGKPDRAWAGAIAARDRHGALPVLDDADIRSGHPTTGQRQPPTERSTSSRDPRSRSAGR